MPAINYELLALFGKFGGAMLGLLLLVWVIAVLTPKAAAFIDKLAGKRAESASLSSPRSDIDSSGHAEPPQEGSEEIIDSENYKVYSVFEDRPKNNGVKP